MLKKKEKNEKVKKELDTSEVKTIRKKKKMHLKISFFTILVFLMDIGVICGLYVIQKEEFKTFWVTSAMTTMTHKYLAYTLYNEETINRIMSENYIESSTEEVNLDDIVINEGDLFSNLRGRDRGLHRPDGVPARRDPGRAGRAGPEA